MKIMGLTSDENETGKGKSKDMLHEAQEKQDVGKQKKQLVRENMMHDAHDATYHIEEIDDTLTTVELYGEGQCYNKNSSEENAKDNGDNEHISDEGEEAAQDIPIKLDDTIPREGDYPINTSRQKVVEQDIICETF